MSESNNMIEHFRKMMVNSDSISDTEIVELTLSRTVTINRESYEHLIEDLDEINRVLKEDNKEEWNLSDMLMADMFLIYKSDSRQLESVNLIINPPESVEEVQISIYNWLYKRLEALIPHFSLTPGEAMVRIHVVAILFRNPQAVIAELENAASDEVEEVITKLYDEDHKMFG